MAGGEGGNHDVGHVDLLEGRGGEKQRDQITAAGHCRRVPSPCPALGGDTRGLQSPSTGKGGAPGGVPPAFTWICCCRRLILCCCWMSCCCCLAIWRRGDSGAQRHQRQRPAGPGGVMARHELPNTGKTEARGLRRVPGAVGRAGRAG